MRHGRGSRDLGVGGSGPPSTGMELSRPVLGASRRFPFSDRVIVCPDKRGLI